MTNEPTFSVVIPTCHRNDSLALCLDRLAPGAQTLPFDRYEVIVTDDGTETTAEDLVRQRYPWAQWTQGPRRGPAANRNHGASLARGEWLAFTDDDCLPDAEWLEGYGAAAGDPGHEVLEGLTYTDRPRRTLAESAPVNLHGGALWSCNMAVRAATFARLGGFDERFPFPGCEDVAFRCAIIDSGLTISFVPHARVCHPLVSRGGWAQARRYVASNIVFSRLFAETAWRPSPLMLIRHALVTSAKVFLREAWRVRWKGTSTELFWLCVRLYTAVRLVPVLSAARVRRGGGYPSA